MEFNLLTKELIMFGFNENDIELMNKILTSNTLEYDIKLLDIPGQLFDFGSFVRIVIENKQFRQKIVKILKNEVADYQNLLLNQMTFNSGTIHFKLNLFLLIISSLEEEQKINPLYNQFLELDKNNEKKHITLIDAFFEMIRSKDLSVNSSFNLFSKATALERSGWVLNLTNLSHKESIAEHMYNMYLLGLLYLPEKLDDGSYNKNTILEMVLIHDLAETVTGDIPHPLKKELDELNEDLQAKALFCNLMYNGIKEASKLYDLWCVWSANLTINAKIAHDLDSIQLNYQFMKYAHEHKEVFNDEAILKWTRRQPKTSVGKLIYKKVILENEIFKERIGVINGKYNDYGNNSNS